MLLAMNRTLCGALVFALVATLLLPSDADVRAGPGDAGQAGHAAADRPWPAAGRLLNLAASLLVVLRPGVDLAAVDAAAATRGLTLVAWNPVLRTAQYVVASGSATEIGAERAAAGDLHVSGRGGELERSLLARIGADLGRAAGVVAARPPIRLRVLADPTPVPPPMPTPGSTPPSVPAPDPGPAPEPTLVPAPSDPRWGEQWGPDAAGARAAWAWTRGRPEIVVAVLDTGVDLGHPDLARRLVPGIDLGSGDGDPGDEDGHGTHVAGIIAAASDNGIGVSGAAPGVVVMPVKVMGDDGSILEQTVAEGITWAVARGARVVNLSLGGDEESPAINAAIDNARAQGVVVVAAAGNHVAVSLDPGVEQPGAYGPALTVAAVDDAGEELGPPGTAARYAHASYSNAGSQVDLAAPGSAILSTTLSRDGDAYGTLDGTSMATSFVSAAAALVLSRNPSLTAGEVETALVATATDLGPAGPDPETGAGLVNMGAAVASVATPPSDGAAPAPRISGVLDGSVVRGTLAMSITASDASPVVATRLYRDGAYHLVRRSGTLAVRWNSTGTRDGLHRWQAYATDAGLNVGSASARVLVANTRAVATVRGTLLMTTTARSVTRQMTLAKPSPVVVRVTGPALSLQAVRVIDASGRVVAEARGSGAAVIALSSLRAGRYTIRASTPVAVPSSSLRLVASWFP